MKEIKEKDSLDYLLDEDIEKINTIQKNKRKLMSYFKNDFMVETIKKLIDNSKYISFVSERSKKFVDVKQPVFNLKINLEEFISDYNINLYVRTEESMTSTVQSCLNNEVYKPFSHVLFDTIKQQPNDSDIFKEIPDIYDVLLLSSIFAIRIDLANSKVILEYLF